MASYLTQNDVAYQPSFQARVQQAMDTAAINVQAEAANTPNHTNRATFARAVLQAPQQYVLAFALGVASQGIDNTATDATIQNTINSLWNAYAGTV